MKIGIMGALPEEISSLKADLERSENLRRVGGRKFQPGTLYEKDVVLAYPRSNNQDMGKSSAAAIATILYGVFQVDIIIFIGMAGAISPDLELGDVVVANSLAYHDYDVTRMGLPGVSEVGQLPEYEYPFKVKEKYVERAKEAVEAFLRGQLEKKAGEAALSEAGIREPKTSVGLIVSGDTFVSSDTRKDRIKESFSNLSSSVECLEMEGASVKQTSIDFNKPTIVIRSISDEASGTARDKFEAFTKKLAPYYSRGIIKELIPKLE